MTKIHFAKTFLSGSLLGLTVETSYSVPNVASIVDNHVNNLAMITKKIPAKDLITSAKYFVSNIKVIR